MADDDEKEKMGQAEDDASERAPDESAEDANAAVGDSDGAEAKSHDADDEAENREKALDDAYSPAAIAKRVQALGADTNEEAIARAEEAKLEARKKRVRARTGKKKRGLQQAASKRLDRIGKGKSTSVGARTVVANAVDADPLLERTTEVSKWLSANKKLVFGVVGAGALVLAGFGIMRHIETTKNHEASALLVDGLEAQGGRIGDPEQPEDDDSPVRDPRPVFKTTEARRKAATEKLTRVGSEYPGTGAAYLAELAHGSLLLDARDGKGALAAFEAVLASPLAQADDEVRGRALEGAGFALELRAKAEADKKTELLEQASKRYRELENTDIKGFKELGMYHQARVFEAQGDKKKATEFLKSLIERLKKPGENHPFAYLEPVASDRLRILDPTALPERQAGDISAPGGAKLSQEQIQRLIEQMQQRQKQEGSHGGGHQH